MNVSYLFQRITQAIHPSLQIGGLEISDAFLRYVSISGDKATTTVVRLSPGILDNCIVVHRDAFASALRSLHQQLVQSHEPLHIVATIASSHVYTQVVRLPAVPAEQYDAALDLALRANSPLDADSVYYDAELLGLGAGNEREFLAAFVDRALIDQLHNLLIDVGFTVVAMEFPALSAARVLSMLGRGFDAQQPTLFVAVVPRGVDLMIVRNGHLLFHYWQSFRSIRDNSEARAIDAAVFRSTAASALQRTLNFYTAQWNGAISSAIVLGRGVVSTLQPLLDQFGLRVLPLSASRFDDVATTAPFALGAALRGLIPRRHDTSISIAPVGTEAGFLRAQSRHFVSVWRSIFVVAASGIFLFFLVADVFLAQRQAQFDSGIPFDDQVVARRDAGVLRDQALAFNQSVDFVAAAFMERGAFASLLTDFRRLAGSGILLKRIAFQSRDRSVAITGRASSGFAAIDFKNILARQAQFDNVVLPFARITTEDSGVSFQLTMNLR